MEKELRYMAGNVPNWSGASPLTNVIARALELGGGWSVANMRKPGFRLMGQAETEWLNGTQFRTAAPMVDKAQVAVDRAVVEVGLQRLTLVADILAAGLTYPLTDPLSVPQLEWHSVNKVGAAQRTMSPAARGENKQQIAVPSRLPIYLTTDQFEIDIRTLKTSQRVGMPLDTALVKQCTRAVNEAIEDAAINGATTLDGQDLKVAGFSAPGILNAPNAETQNLTAAAWTTAPVGATVFNELMAMIKKLQDNKKFGPYHLYVGTQIGNALDTDYNSGSANPITIRSRLLQIESIRAIRVADLMPAGNGATPSIGNKVALVQMTSDVIDIVDGQRPTVIPWTSLDGFMIHNLVMAIMIPRVRSDFNGDSGICIGTTA